VASAISFSFASEPSSATDGLIYDIGGSSFEEAQPNSIMLVIIIIAINFTVTPLM
jgi:hypothetical protein